MLNVFIRKALALRTLRKSHAFSESAVVRFGVGRVECFDGGAAGDADWHCRGLVVRGYYMVALMGVRRAKVDL